MSNLMRSIISIISLVGVCLIEPPSPEKAPSQPVVDKSGLIRWLIDRYDNLVVAVSSRCATVLAADAFLLGVVTFTIDKYFSSSTGAAKSGLTLLIAWSLGLGLLIVMFSIFFATTGIVTVWAPSIKYIGANPPQRFFFHTRDTLEQYPGFDSFSEAFRQTGTADLDKYALGELWTVITLNHMRYQSLRKATMCTVFALMPLSLAILGMLVQKVVSETSVVH